jgi:hypothetical protein
LSIYLVVLGIGFVILLLAIFMSFIFARIIRWYLNRQFDKLVKRLVTEPYGKNLWEGITGIRHMGIQWMMENELRSAKAEALPKPIGTHRPFPHFDGLLLNPVQLHRRPVEELKHVDLQIGVGGRIIVEQVRPTKRGPKFGEFPEKQFLGTGNRDPRPWKDIDSRTESRRPCCVGPRRRTYH